MSRRRILAYATLVVGALLLGMNYPYPAHAGVVTSTPITVLTQNVSGARLNHSRLVRRLSASSFTKEKAARVLDVGADVVAWEEVTEDQYLAVRKRLAPHGYRVYFSPQRDDVHTGMVVAVLTSVSATKVVHYLPTPSYGHDPRVTDVRRLLCVRTELHGVPVLACGIHASQVNPDRDLQIAEARRWLGKVRTATVLAGDFNRGAGTDAMQSLSSLYADPMMNDAGRDWTVTAASGRQAFDSAYWSGTMATRVTADSGKSDHREVVATGVLVATP